MFMQHALVNIRSMNKVASHNMGLSRPLIFIKFLYPYPAHSANGSDQGQRYLSLVRAR
jgi:hypothetical protein